MNPATEQMRSYADTLAAVLRCFEGCKGSVIVVGRTLSGLGQQDAHLSPPFDALPMPVLNLLADGFSLRLSPATRSGQALDELPFLSILWRPKTVFSKATAWRHAVDPEAAAQIAAALATMPAPSLLIDAGPEVWAGWRLTEPVDLRQQLDAARVTQAALAQRLDADVQTAEDVTATLPFAGPVRNWGAHPPFIEVVIAAPERTYRIEQLLDPTPEGGGAS
jgi:hypothetical protein